jgi:hypothetical protein
MNDFSRTQLKNICGMPMLDTGRTSARSSTKSLEGSEAESSCPVMTEEHHFDEDSVSHHNELLLEATKDLAISSARSPSLFWLAVTSLSVSFTLSLSSESSLSVTLRLHLFVS